MTTIDTKPLEEQGKLLAQNIKQIKAAVLILHTSSQAFSNGAGTEFGCQQLREVTQELRVNVERWTQLVGDLDHAESEQSQQEAA